MFRRFKLPQSSSYILDQDQNRFGPISTSLKNWQPLTIDSCNIKKAIGIGNAHFISAVDTGAEQRRR